MFATFSTSGEDLYASYITDVDVESGESILTSC